MIRIGSLFSGIGGLEVGLLAAFVEAGIPAKVEWNCEIEAFCDRVLRARFPETRRFQDVSGVSFPPRVDLLCGGFACQDVSAAGKGAGLGIETRSGFTLYHLLRIIDEVESNYVVIENVASGAKRWLPRVVQELRDRGYQPYAVPLGADDVGASHRRKRVFVIGRREGVGQADPFSSELREQPGRRDGEGGSSSREPRDFDKVGVADPDRSRLLRSGVLEELEGRTEAFGSGEVGGGVGQANALFSGQGGTSGEGECHSRQMGDEFEGLYEREDKVEPGLGGGPDGLPFDVAGRPFPAFRGTPQKSWEPPRALPKEEALPERAKKLKALGNAVVPQCALVVGRIVVAMMTGTSAH